MPATDLTHVDDIVERWPYDFQHIDPDAGSGSLDSDGTFDVYNVTDVTSTEDVSGTLDVESGTVDVESSQISHYEYLSVFASQMQYIDERTNDLYNQRFIDTATGRELEKLGAPLGITPRANESESSFRYRVKLGKAISTSDGTAKDIKTILSIAFADKEIENIDVGTVDGEPITTFTIPSAYIEDIPITEAELNNLLTRAFPCGTEAQVISGDTFELGATGDKGLGNGNLT